MRAPRRGALQGLSKPCPFRREVPKRWRRKIMKKVKILEREVPIVVLLLVLFAGIGSAALLNYYGQISTTVNIKQAIVLDGNTCTGTMGGGCTSEDTVNAVGSETEYGNLHTLSSNTENDLDVKFSNTDNCGDTLITNMVELSIVGFDSSDPEADGGFAAPYYKKSYYEGDTTIDKLESIEYSFRILENTFSSNNLAPYIVLVSDKFESDVAVSMIPDGGTYEDDTNYVKIVDEDTEFHIPGSSVCTQASPCTLSYIKANYDGDITKVIVAAGAWPDVSHPTYSVLAGVGEINGEQAVHKSFKVYGNTAVDMQNRYDFADNIMAGTCTITTHIEPIV
jgi:hypothetical protein